MGAGLVKHIIRLAVAAEVPDCNQCPAGWKFWAVLGRDETVVVEIPDRGFARSPIEQSVVRMTITVNSRHINQVPVLAQRRTCSAPQVGVVIQIPNGSFVQVRTE